MCVHELASKTEAAPGIKQTDGRYTHTLSGVLNEVSDGSAKGSGTAKSKLVCVCLKQQVHVCRRGRAQHAAQQGINDAQSAVWFLILLFLIRNI